MKNYRTSLAAKANPMDVAVIYNESQTSQLSITMGELEDYEAHSGFGVEDVTPDWLFFDLLMWCNHIE
jgi:hypothetical protein